MVLSVVEHSVPYHFSGRLSAIDLPAALQNDPCPYTARYMVLLYNVLVDAHALHLLDQEESVLFSYRDGAIHTLPAWQPLVSHAVSQSRKVAPHLARAVRYLKLFWSEGMDKVERCIEEESSQGRRIVN